jgi:hypothetical protein
LTYTLRKGLNPFPEITKKQEEKRSKRIVNCLREKNKQRFGILHRWFQELMLEE